MKFIHPIYRYWDIAGVDGLQVAQQLFGHQVDRIAPFQSLQTQLDGDDCSVLRLCEGNFRIGSAGDPAAFQAILQPLLGAQVWVKQFDWLAVLTLIDPDGSALDFDWSTIAAAKPPHRLSDLANHCAAPARIDDKALLIWRHPVLGQPAVELQMAARDQGSIKTHLEAVLPIKI
jgi:hypothetical protein